MNIKTKSIFTIKTLYIFSLLFAGGNTIYVNNKFDKIICARMLLVKICLTTSIHHLHLYNEYTFVINIMLLWYIDKKNRILRSLRNFFLKKYLRQIIKMIYVNSTSKQYFTSHANGLSATHVVKYRLQKGKD